MSFGKRKKNQDKRCVMNLGNEKAICGVNSEARVDSIEKMKMARRLKRGGAVRHTHSWGQVHSCQREQLDEPLLSVI